MVLVGEPGEVNKRGNYRLGRVVRLNPKWRRGTAIVRRAVITVPNLMKQPESTKLLK